MLGRVKGTDFTWEVNRTIFNLGIRFDLDALIFSIFVAATIDFMVSWIGPIAPLLSVRSVTPLNSPQRPQRSKLRTLKVNRIPELETGPMNSPFKDVVMMFFMHNYTYSFSWYLH